MMRVRHLSVASAVCLTACLFPAESGQGYRVSIDSVPGFLVTGDVYPLSGRLIDEKTGRVLEGAELRFDMATVPEAGQSGIGLPSVITPNGQFYAVGPGDYRVTATAPGFPLVIPAYADISVRAASLDSVRPARVRFGDTLRLYGRGITGTSIALPTGERILLPELKVALFDWAAYLPDSGGVSALAQPAVVLTRLNDPSGISYAIVRPPAPESAAVVLEAFGLRSAARAIQVDQWDLYEPNDTTPAELVSLTLDGVALEAKAFSGAGGPRDWYTFTHVGTDVQISITSMESDVDLVLSDSLIWDQLNSRHQVRRWQVGSELACRGARFRPQRVGAVVRSLRLRYPPARLHLLVSSSGRPRPAEYRLSITPLVPTSPEEVLFFRNGICDSAQALSDPPVPAPGFGISGVLAAGWFSYTVAGPDPDRVAVGVSGSVQPIVPELNVYVLRDFTPDSLPLVARGIREAGGIPDVVLTPGHYYVVVVPEAPLPSAVTQYRVSLLRRTSAAPRPP